MKIMCDTNIIPDVLLEREPFVTDSCKVLSLCEEHKNEKDFEKFDIIWRLLLTAQNDL